MIEPKQLEEIKNLLFELWYNAYSYGRDRPGVKDNYTDNSEAVLAKLREVAEQAEKKGNMCHTCKELMNSSCDRCQHLLEN